MITPLIIQIIFWIGALGVFIWGIVLIATAHDTGYYGGGDWEAGQIIGGILTMIFGPLLVRIWCEMLILFFRMNETLTEIKNNTQK
jgi:ABC-type cobalt transport system substrate-binding protein